MRALPGAQVSGGGPTHGAERCQAVGRRGRAAAAAAAVTASDLDELTVQQVVQEQRQPSLPPVHSGVRDVLWCGFGTHVRTHVQAARQLSGTSGTLACADSGQRSRVAGYNRAGPGGQQGRASMMTATRERAGRDTVACADSGRRSCGSGGGGRAQTRGMTRMATIPPPMSALSGSNIWHALWPMTGAGGPAGQVRAPSWLPTLAPHGDPQNWHCLSGCRA